MIIWRIWPLVNDQPEDPATCKWSSWGTGNLQMIIQRIRLLQMIIWRIQPLANDQLEDPATCKWSSGGTGHLQMIIRRIFPLANDHSEDPATCKLSSRGSGLLQMIIWRIWALANDHLEGPASYKWSPVTIRHPNHLSQDPDSISRTFLEQFVLFCLISQIFSSTLLYLPFDNFGMYFFVCMINSRCPQFSCHCPNSIKVNFAH